MADAINYQKITGDNRRPGMDPSHKWLVRYNPHATFGWLSCRTFLAEPEARQFAKDQVAK